MQTVIQKLKTWWTSLQQTDAERYLSHAVDAADLKVRIQHLRDRGIPA